MVPRRPSAAFSRRLLLAALVASLGFRLWLSAVLPLSGDEAYFYYWGKSPDLGFYDHPPMVGWWLAALLHLSEAEWMLRLPAVLLPAFLSLGVAWLLRIWRYEDPWLGALLVVLAPAHVWNVAITTDTPLVYFSFLSGLAFLRAARDDALRYYALAGVFLGLAFLSKYFAVLLGLAYLCHALWRPNVRKWAGLAVIVAAVVPFAALNIWWNWQNCWSNIMFNLYNRHGNAGLSWKTPLLYAAMILYLLTPPGASLIGRGRAQLARWASQARLRALLCVALVPLAVFAALSLVKLIGMHWVLSFLPFALLVASLLADERARRRLLRFFAAFALAQVVLIVTAFLLPVETWKFLDKYPSVVMTMKPQEVLAVLKPYEQEYIFAADGYSPAVTLSYNGQRYFFVFGEGSSHARHDDILTDLRAADGRDILVLLKSAPERAHYDPYFSQLDYRQFDVHGARYYLVLGRDFRYPAYRDAVLDKVRRRYYAIPGYLPVGACYFCDRYFPGLPCRKDEVKR